MRNTIISYLLLPLIAGFSLSLSAAPSSSAVQAPPELVVSKPAAVGGPIDLNLADAGTLQRELNGIGKTKAEAIVAYREANGPFMSVDELLEIKGIGKSLLERNRDKLKVE